MDSAALPADDRRTDAFGAQEFGRLRCGPRMRAAARSGVDEEGDVHGAKSAAAGAGTSAPDSVYDGVRVERLLHSSQDIDPEPSDLGLEVRKMVTPHGVMVGDRPARRPDRAGCGFLRPSPLGDRAARERRDDR